LAEEKWPDADIAVPTAPKPVGAVFISYASQDAEAAKRICDALRVANVEVWFDQSELRGGDVWDRQIRQQIQDLSTVRADCLGKHGSASRGLLQA
jgi:TIR domain